MVMSVTDQTQTPAPVENVSRGAALAVLSIPAAIILFIIAGGVLQLAFAAIASILVPYIALTLYQRGAGAPLSRKGWGPFIAVAAVAVIVGTFTGIIALAWALYLGDGGILSESFLRTLGNQIGSTDGLLALVLGLGIGAAAILGAVRGPRTKTAAEPAQAPAPDASAVPAVPASAPTAPVAPPAVAAPPVANQPSPGVMLNGKPVDPNKR